MTLQTKFSDQQLAGICEEAMIYMCACPAQVARQMLEMRKLIRYQEDCLNAKDDDSRVHEAIAKASMLAHGLLEDCLDEILTIEGWDRASLKMPAGLRELRDQIAGE